MLKSFLLVLFSLCFSSITAQYTINSYHSTGDASPFKGWNTWSYDNMLTHAQVPSGFSLTVNFRQTFIGNPYDQQYFLNNINPGREGLVKPIAHAQDGSYTELEISNWKGNVIRVQSCTIGRDICILVTPVVKSSTQYTIELESGILWNGTGSLARERDAITASVGDEEFTVRATRHSLNKIFPYKTPFLCFSGDSAVAFYSGIPKTQQQAEIEISEARDRFYANTNKHGSLADTYNSIETILGWNTIYDPVKKQVITPVSRGWNEAWQGYVLFEWDTFFGALLATTCSKDLAYANVFALLNGTEPEHVGFWHMPGMEAVQSQPPVGSMICWMIYEKFGEMTFLEKCYPHLLRWNRWWMKNRYYKDYLTWGAPWKGADHRSIVLESGLDNSPMYEGITVVESDGRSYLSIADVGLNSLYVADCQYLAKIARQLGNVDDEKELTGRANTFSKKVASLWNEEMGLFLNKDLSTNEFSRRLSPTLFYPMIVGIPTKAQAKRMISEHFHNPKEFYGDYILPSCARNDPSYDNNYWRGSVWPPMNFLVYIGLRNYDRNAASELANRSFNMYAKAWTDLNCIFENINSEKGALKVEDQVNADTFYHWGALLGYMMLIEKNFSEK